MQAQTEKGAEGSANPGTTEASRIHKMAAVRSEIQTKELACNSVPLAKGSSFDRGNFAQFSLLHRSLSTGHGAGIFFCPGLTVELPLREHCCSYRSKPACLWEPFWLFSRFKKQADPKNIFCKKKWAYGKYESGGLRPLHPRCQRGAARA